MKVRIRKSLSVLLTIMMVVTSLSVAFSIPVSAAGELQAFKDKLALIPAGERASFTVSTHSNSASGTTTITDNTTNGTIYDAAVAFRTYFLTALTLGNTNTNNAAYYTWWTKLYRGIISSDTTFFTPYASLISALCDNANTSRGTPYTYDNNTTKGGGLSKHSVINANVVVNRTEEKAINRYATISALPATVGISVTYGATGQANGSMFAFYNNFGAYVAGSETNSNTLITQLKAIDTFYSNQKTFAQLLALGSGANGIGKEITNLGTVKTTYNSLPAAVKTKYFNAARLAEMTTYENLILDAEALINYKADVEYYHGPNGDDGFINEIFTVDTYDKTPAGINWMNTKFYQQEVYYTRLTGLTQGRLDLLDSYYGLDMDAVDDAREKLWDDLQNAHLVELKRQIDVIYNAYHNAQEDYNALEDLVLQGAYSELVPLLAAVNQRTAAQIAKVFTAGTGYVSSFIQELKWEMNVRELQPIATANWTYFLGLDQYYKATLKAADVTNKITEARGKLATATANVTDAQSLLRADDFETLYGNFLPTAQGVLKRLETALEARFAEQVAMAMKAYTDVGSITWENFTLVKYFIDLIEGGIYDFFVSSTYMSAQTRDDYLKLKGLILDEYNNFVKDGGFANFVQLELNPYPFRDMMLNDLVKTIGYQVSESDLTTILAKLDTLITSPEFTALAGMDIGACVRGLTSCACSDSMVNCIVQVLYPAILDAFEGAWAGLPTEQKIEGDVTGTARINVVALHDVLASTVAENTINGLTIYPDLLAGTLPSEFNVAKQQMSDAMAGMDWTVNATKESTEAWKKLEDANGKLKINWGVDNPTDPTMIAKSKGERFEHALSSALVGVFPLLQALLLGQPYDSYAYKVASIPETTLKAYGIISVKIFFSRVWLDLKATGNEGYAKVITPLFELLLGEDTASIPNKATLNTMNKTSDFVAAFTTPIKAVIEKLATSPLDQLANMLPNLAYAMSFNQIAPLLDELALFVKYTPDGKTEGCALATSQKPYLRDAADLAGSVSLNVGEVVFGDPDNAPINLSCTSDLNGFLQKLPSCLSSGNNECNFSMPMVNAGCVSRLGIMDPTTPTKRVGGDGVWTRSADGTPVTQTKPPVCSSVRHYIKTDKADFVYGLLQMLMDKSFVDAIMNTVCGAPAPGQPSCLESCTMIGDIVANMSGDNQGDAIAALAELINPKREPYAFKPTVVPQDLALAQQGSLVQEQSSYTDIWTKNHAKYLAVHMDDFVNKTITMLFGKDLNAIVSGLLGASVYSHQTLDLLFGTLKDAVEDLDISEFEDFLPLINIDVVSIIDMIKNVDVASLSFTDGNKTQFISVLNTVLQPLVPVLDLLLSGQSNNKNIEVLGGFITAFGYDGYGQGLVPILEALGCDLNLIKTQAEFAADPANKIGNILTPIFGLLDKILQDPVNSILNILPNILYFADSGMLANAVSNLIHPILVLLDTIRPLYDMELPLSSYLSMSGILELLTGALGMELPFDVRSMISGKYEAYDSKRGERAVRIVQNNDTKADLYNTVLSQVVKIVMDAINVEPLKEAIKEFGVLDAGNLNAVYGIIDTFYGRTPELIIYGLFYVFAGAEFAVDTANQATKDANKYLYQVTKQISKESTNPSLKYAAGKSREILSKYGSYFEDILDVSPESPTVAPNGFMKFIYGILNFFRRLFGMEALEIPVKL